MTSRQMRTAIFVTGASAQIGGGHVLRCLALAEGLQSRNFRPIFAVSKGTVEAVGLLAASGFEVLEIPNEEAYALDLARHADVAIFDGYAIDRSIEKRWRDRATARLVIDDLANRPHDCELLVDPSPGREKKDYAELLPEKANVLAGPSFALLRREFRQLRSSSLARRSGGRLRKILVSMGLTDIDGITKRVVEGVLLADREFECDVVVGAGARSLPWLRSMERRPGLKIHQEIDGAAMARLMAEADAAIGGGGGTSLERCCMGLPSFIVVLADNQRLIAGSLHDCGAVQIIGTLSDTTASTVANALTSLKEKQGELVHWSQIAATVVDGAGADRVSDEILRWLS